MNQSYFALSYKGVQLNCSLPGCFDSADLSAILYCKLLILIINKIINKVVCFLTEADRKF